MNPGAACAAARVAVSMPPPGLILRARFGSTVEALSLLWEISVVGGPIGEWRWYGGLPGRPRLSAGARRGLRHRVRAVPVARTGRVQLGARLVRRGRRRQRCPGPVDRRGGRPGAAALLRRPGPAFEPGGEPPAGPRCAARGPAPAHAGQP